MSDERTPNDVSSLDSESGTDKSTHVHFHYIKGTHFRVICAEGAYGGIHPGGKKLNMAFYNERVPIPQRVTSRLAKDTDGSYRIADEVVSDRITRDGIIREVECDVVMDFDTAVVVVRWMVDKLKAVGIDPFGEVSTENKEGSISNDTDN